MRTFVLAALVAAPLALATPASASPCMPEQPCPVCPFWVVVENGKPRIEHAQC